MNAFYFQRKRAFTLLEILVSISVLTIILLLFTQIIGVVSETWRAGVARADNFAQARVVLGLIERDVQAMVLRPDLPAFVDENGKTACAFYTRYPGVGPGRRLSLISYELTGAPAQPKLQRGDYGFQFSNATGPAGPRYGDVAKLSDLDNTQRQPLVEAVLAFQIQFIRVDGQLATTYKYNAADPLAGDNTSAVIVSMVVLDSGAYGLAQQSGALPSVAGTFNGALPAGETYAQHWGEIIGSGNLPAGIPKPVSRGLRAFERRILLPQSTVR